MDTQVEMKKLTTDDTTGKMKSNIGKGSIIAYIQSWKKPPSR